MQKYESVNGKIAVLPVEQFPALGFDLERQDLKRILIAVLDNTVDREILSGSRRRGISNRISGDLFPNREGSPA
ncbi:MAG: hypothetical protein U5N56_00555 [Candidatus Marinimicrobia bacterium]|nr:hypothetical protein [Candidatus Neomarinimicrobiota bacterium]